MIKKITLMAIYCCFSFLLISQESTGEIRPVHIGFIYPLSTNGIDAPQIQNRFSLHAIGGISAGELGICLSGFGHLTRGNVKGAQLSGFFNAVTGHVEGLLLSGFGNTAFSLQGIQGAGFGNVSQNIKGVQVAGFGNVSKQVEGIQVAGFGNVSSNSTGIQAAGFGNVSGNKKGIQTAGFINVAEDIRGIQVAGFINVAKKVKGFQVAGFINVADSSDYPIGIINVIRKGEMHIQASVDELGNTILDFRSGGRKTYGFIGIGVNFFRNATLARTSHFGIGINLRASKLIAFRPEIHITNILQQQAFDFQYAQSLRLLADIKIGKVHLFAGPGLSLIRSNMDSLENVWNIHSWTRGSQTLFLIGGWRTGLSFRILS